ncbi:DinB family protein [Paenibacillus sp. UMB4589-SE434]|uniref:DinB family protein n=1 Tax=Paenibacillus sp. UMB4589-SE434 TaxID=3046314 RepID=UPI00254FD9B5|nr:DinB family protein [Paenibacillus sp. UMB4589-SE434]MDK8181905.1 DinB family protein [Paenibacillus sp. UMB4589-SE434]
MGNNARKLYSYHVWANEKLIKHLKALPDTTTWTQQVQSVFPSIRETLLHIYSVDNVWLLTVSNDTINIDEMITEVGRIRTESETWNIEQLEAQFHTLAGRYVDFMEQQGDLDEAKQISHPHYGTLDTSYSDLIQHVVNHGTYHRGNVTAMLRQLGQAGTATDYIHYLYDLTHQ